MTISLIGAGYGRTGTLSLKSALETLGYNKCHHMIEVIRESWRTRRMVTARLMQKPLTGTAYSMGMKPQSTGRPATFTKSIGRLLSESKGPSKRQGSPRRGSRACLQPHLGVIRKRMQASKAGQPKNLGARARGQRRFSAARLMMLNTPSGCLTSTRRQSWRLSTRSALANLRRPRGLGTALPIFGQTSS